MAAAGRLLGAVYLLAAAWAGAGGAFAWLGAGDAMFAVWHAVVLAAALKAERVES